MSSKVLEYGRDDPAWLHEPNYLDYDEIVDTDEYDDGEVNEGKYFFADGEDWMWLESIGDEYHMDFDDWQVWRATNGKTEEFFVVEVDTGFIDWGPCSEREAREFLESKYQDYLSEEFESDYSDTGIDEIIEVNESYDGSYGDGSIAYPVHMSSAEVGMSGDDFDIIGTIHADSEDEANEILSKYFTSTRGTKYYLGYPEELTDDIIEVDELSEDTVKKANGMWTNRGDDGKEHGEFKTKKAADVQRKAMFANGYKAESDECTDEELDDIVDEDVGYSLRADFKDEIMSKIERVLAKCGFKKRHYNIDVFDHDANVNFEYLASSFGNIDKAVDMLKKIDGISNVGYSDHNNRIHMNVNDSASDIVESANVNEKRFYVDINGPDGKYYDSMYVYCDRKNQCQKEINKMLGSKYKVAHIWEEEDEATNPGAIPSVPGPHKTIDDECIHDPKKIRMFRDLDKKDESVVTEEMDRNSKAFYQKVMELKKYVDTVSRVIKDDQKVDKQSMTVAIQKIGTIYDELVNIRDYSD